MYSTTLKPTDRSRAIIAALAVQAAFLAAFLNLSEGSRPTSPQARLSMFDVPRHDDPQVSARKTERTRLLIRSVASTSGGRSAAKRDRRAQMQLPPLAFEASARAIGDVSSGSNAAGAQDGRGAGTGVGTGNGSGDGAGHGNGTAVEPPHLATAVLGAYDFPRDLIAHWPRNITVFLRLRIDPRGYVSECLIDRGTNVPAIDAEMCNTAHERLRFRPAIDNSGEAVAGWFGYAQPAPR